MRNGSRTIKARKPMGSRHQQQRHQGLDDQAHRDNAAPVRPVCHVPSHQREQQGGQKLVQANQAQIPRAAGQLVHLPAHGHEQHLVARGPEQACEPHAHECTLVHEV